MVKAPDCNQRFTYTTDLTHLEEKVGDQDIDLLLTRSRGLYWGILAQSRAVQKQPDHDCLLFFPAFENKQYMAYNRNGLYGKFPTKKEPIATVGFTSRLPFLITICYIRQLVVS